jgi:hypothetical protein
MPTTTAHVTAHVAASLAVHIAIRRRRPRLDGWGRVDALLGHGLPRSAG